jgi:hypothetical protein
MAFIFVAAGFTEDVAEETQTAWTGVLTSIYKQHIFQPWLL